MACATGVGQLDKSPDLNYIFNAMIKVLKSQGMVGLMVSLFACGTSARADIGQAESATNAGIVENGPACGGNGCGPLWLACGGNGCSGLSFPAEQFVVTFNEEPARLLGDSKGNG